MTIPKELLTCQDEPQAPPKVPAPTNAQVAEYLTEGVMAARDCRAKLAEVSKLNH